MKISQILKDNKVTVSFEIFPPKQWEKIESSKQVVAEIAKTNPAFMSVTYGAAGTTSGFTTEMANTVKENGITPLSHLTCLTSTKEKIHQVVNEFQSNGVKNILALRGDIPQGFEWENEQYFSHAYQLINEIKNINPELCVGAACYPEIHPESKNRIEDIEYLKQKVDCGADFLTSQMFFDNEKFLDFYEMCQIKGINVPIIAGIMPITNANLIKRSIELSNSSLPRKFYKIMERFGNDPQKMMEAGIIYATDQIIDLMANGINNIHVYTMNKPYIANSIMDRLANIINE